MSLSDYIALARRWWWLALLGCVVAASAAFFVTDRLTPIYQAKAVLLVNQAQASGAVSYQDILGSQQLTKTYAQIVTAKGNLDRATETLGDSGVTTEILKEKVRATAVRETQLITVTAEDPSPERAARIANAVAESFSGYVEEAQLAGNAGADRSLNTVFVAEPAAVPSSPVRPNVVLNVTLGAILGLILTGASIALVEYLDDDVDGREEVERLGLAFFGSIPLAHRAKDVSAQHWVPSIRDGEGLQPLRESYRQLQINLAFAIAPGGVHTIVVTSAGQGEGKSTITANLGQALAESSKRVLIIDGDLRKPDIHRYFDMPNSSGLSSSFLTEVNTIPAFVRTVNERLAVLTSGPVPPNPVELISSGRLADGIRTLVSQFDIVLIDSPPVLGLADASIWATVADGILLVARDGKTRRGSFAEAIAQLRATRKPLIGAVVNGTRRRSAPDYYYAAGYAYGREKEL